MPLHLSGGNLHIPVLGKTICIIMNHIELAEYMTIKDKIKEFFLPGISKKFPVRFFLLRFLLIFYLVISFCNLQCDREAKWKSWNKYV